MGDIAFHRLHSAAQSLRWPVGRKRLPASTRDVAAALRRGLVNDKTQTQVTRRQTKAPCAESLFVIATDAIPQVAKPTAAE